eukprot:5764483-Prymnesium_polylepis.1
MAHAVLFVFITCARNRPHACVPVWESGSPLPCKAGVIARPELRVSLQASSTHAVSVSSDRRREARAR